MWQEKQGGKQQWKRLEKLWEKLCGETYLSKNLWERNKFIYWHYHEIIHFFSTPNYNKSCCSYKFSIFALSLLMPTMRKSECENIYVCIYFPLLVTYTSLKKSCSSAATKWLSNISSLRSSFSCSYQLLAWSLFSCSQLAALSLISGQNFPLQSLWFYVWGRLLLALCFLFFSSSPLNFYFLIRRGVGQSWDYSSLNFFQTVWDQEASQNSVNRSDVLFVSLYGDEISLHRSLIRLPPELQTAESVICRPKTNSLGPVIQSQGIETSGSCFALDPGAGDMREFTWVTTKPQE